MIDGGGQPGGEAFSNALQALYSVSYGAHFALKKATGDAPRVMALEALWWVEGADAQATMKRVAAGEASMAESDRDQRRCRAMIMQLPPIDEVTIKQAVADAKAKKHIASLDDLRYEHWVDGPSAQILHVGPYATKAPSIVALHKAIAEHGSRPRGDIMRSTSVIRVRRHRRSSTQSCVSRSNRRRDVVAARL